MTAMTGKIICPHCAAEMNHHADKLVYSDLGIDEDEALFEFHACPECGASVSRRV